MERGNFQMNSRTNPLLWLFEKISVILSVIVAAITFLKMVYRPELNPSNLIYAIIMAIFLVHFVSSFRRTNLFTALEIISSLKVICLLLYEIFSFIIPTWLEGIHPDFAVNFFFSASIFLSMIFIYAVSIIYVLRLRRSLQIGSLPRE